MSGSLLQPISVNAAFRGLGLGRIAFDEFFQYEAVIGVTPFVLTTGAENFPSIPITIQNDADFLVVETMFTNSLVACAAGSTVPVFANGGGVVQLTDGRTGRPLENAQVPLDSLFGNAREPFVWPLPHVFGANSPLLINFTGQGAGPPSMAAAVVRLVFTGYKVPVGSAERIAQQGFQNWLANEAGAGR